MRADSPTRRAADSSSPFLIPGAGVPEEAAAAAARGQVCVGGEPVHHGGQLQLLRCGGLPERGQRPGECGGHQWGLRPTYTSSQLLL